MCWDLQNRGDGICDDLNNRPECGYDAGDCCLDKITCRNPKSPYCLCSDPNHPNCQGQWIDSNSMNWCKNRAWASYFSALQSNNWFS